MVATVRSLTSASATSEYFRKDGGYYASEGDDEAELKAKQEEHRNGSAWHGEGARALGLEPGKRVSATKFEKLLQGYVIGTNIRLGRKRDGQHEHRPGFDITFSAPKSVSLAALVPTAKHPRGDRVAQHAHGEAVRKTLDWIEKTMLQTRGWDPATGSRPRVNAPAMVAATFRHVASRNLDPQLHTHAVIANMTRDADGRWKSVEPTLLRRNARLIGAYYRDQLARQLIGKGYSIVPTMAGKMPSFEISGYGREICDAFSTRRQEILAYVEEKGLNNSTAAAQIGALATRKQKAEPLRAMLQEEWAKRAKEMGLGTVPSVSRSREPIILPAGPSALEIVGRAMRHLEERQSVFAEPELEALALAHSPGRHSIEEIREAVGWMVRDGHLVEAELRRTDRAFVTDRALKAERSVIAMMKAGIGGGRGLAREEKVTAHLHGSGLTEGQVEAVRTILLAGDRTVGVQGRAGTGKTTMLRQVLELAGARPVTGLAPSAAAARVLEGETGIRARTLQWFLTRCQGVTENGRSIDDLKELFGGSVLVLDEASMVSTDQMRSLMRIADEVGVARLVLVGDTRQLRAVDAGQPFRLLQQAGMTTATMDDIKRQKNPELRAAVLAALAGEPGEAVELLGKSLHEVAHDDLAEEAAQTWLELDRETRDQTLLLAPTHALRAEINRTVRETLTDEGVLRGKALRIERLVNLGMTRAEKGDVRNYREGDTIVFQQNQVNYRVKKDEVLTVAGIEGDRVRLRHPDGRPRKIRPAGSVRYRLDVYETRTIELRAGDRIRWTRNDMERSLINGERAEVTAIDRGRVRLQLADGRTVSLKQDDPQLRHIDYAWSSTVHGAQGSTSDGVIAVLDSGHRALTDQSTFYVEISRARERAVVLTDNLEHLVEVLETNTGERSTALEAVGERFEPDEAELARLARLLPEKAPVWTPREEWTALEELARREATVLFHVEGYEALVERARKLAELPELPAEAREVTDGLLAYDRACREEGAAATEFLGLLDAHADERLGLQTAAETAGRAVAGLDDYRDWRDRSARLATNGKALIEDAGDGADDACERIAERLARLSDLLAMDDTLLAFETLREEVNKRAAAAGTIPFYANGHKDLVGRAREIGKLPRLPAHVKATAEEIIANAEDCEQRREKIGALREETAGLLDERRELEERARRPSPNELGPPTELDGYAAWWRRCEASGRLWRAMNEDRDAWRPHLDRLKDEAKEIAASVDRLDDLRGHDVAWAKFFDARRTILETARAGTRIAFYVEGWAAFVDEARALARRKGLPDAAREAAKRVLDHDRACRNARTAIEKFLNGGQGHGERWNALRDEAARRAQREPDTSIVDLPGYRPLSDSERRLRKTGQAILNDRENYGPHLDRIAESKGNIAAALERLERHDLLDRYVEAMNRIEETTQGARDRGIPPFEDDVYRQAVDEAKRLAEKQELEEAARRRLQDELEQQALLAAEWLVIQQLFQKMAELEQQFRQFEETAGREEIPMPLLPHWQDFQDRNRLIEEDARWTLYDDELVERWRSFGNVLDRIEDGSQRARERMVEPEIEQVAEMVDGELTRLRDPDAEHVFVREWWGGEPLVAGDRLRLRQPPDGPEREAVVLRPGQGGGCIPGDVLTLEWVVTSTGTAARERIEQIPVEDLADCSVRRAEWNDESVRDAQLARWQPGSSAACPLDCRKDVVVGDRVCGTLVVAQEPETALDVDARGAASVPGRSLRGAACAQNGG